MRTERRKPRRPLTPANEPAAQPRPVRRWRNWRAWPWRKILPGLLLVGMTLLVYAPVMWNIYIWDDDAYITRNLTLRSLDGLRAMWFRPLSLPQYYPLVHTTFWLEYHAWGLHPVGYHVDNVLLHAIGALLVWRVMARLRLPWPWLIAALFAVHPVSVESVAWATERKNVLSMALALASMLCYLRVEPPSASEPTTSPNKRGGFYALALLFFIGALLSKTVVATLPAVLLVIYWWQRGRLSLHVVIPLIPMLLLGACLGGYTAWLERYHVGAEGSEWAFTPLERLLIAGRAVWFYAGKLLWPHPIIFFYRRWEIEETALWQYLYPAAVCLTVGALWLARKRLGRGPLAAVLIYCGVLMPALGFLNVFPFRFSFVADHFQHHAMLAIVALEVATMAMIWQRLEGTAQSIAPDGEMASGWRPLTLQRIGVGAVAALLLSLSIISFRQTMAYYDHVSLYSDVIAKNPKCWVAYSNLGVELSARGEKDVALELFRKSLAIDPKKARVNSNYGQALITVGRRDGYFPGQLQEALEHFEYALSVDPDLADAHAGMAEILLEMNNKEDAKKHMRDALRLQPRYTQVLLASALMMIKDEEWREAEEVFHRLIEIKPSVPEAYHGVGLSLLNQNRPRDAIVYFQKSLLLDPDSFEAHYNMANALFMVGELHAAAEHYNEALRIKPDYLEALSNLGVTLGSMGDADDAIKCFEHLLRLDPQYNGAAANLEKARELSRQQQAKKQGQPTVKP